MNTVNEYVTFAQLTQCGTCLEFLYASPGLAEAWASVGIEHGKSSYQMATEYIPYLHRKHLDAVKGHGLIAEGTPFGDDGKILRNWGPGRGKCRCGLMSEVVKSTYKRKQWHRAHKADLVATALGKRYTA